MKIVQVVLSLICLAAVGCGPTLSTEPVSGKITVDGQPVEGILVTLVAEEGTKAMTLAGATDASGNFSITGPGGVVGAPVGKYKVMLTPPQQERDYATGQLKGKEIKFPEFYCNPKAANMTTVDVGSGENKVAIDVDTK